MTKDPTPGAVEVQVGGSGSDRWRGALKALQRDRQLYVIILLPVVFIIIFHYVPMYGAQIAFKDYFVRKGILGSPWVGLTNFELFFKSPMFERVVVNTVRIAFFSLLVGFPMPILLALSLNEVGNRAYQRTVQMVTYAPFFISTVIMVSMILEVLSPRTGFINHIMGAVGAERKNFMADPDWFTPIFVASGVWQHTGWGSIIYLAALAGISPELYDAAVVDGASRLQKIRYIDIPGIMPTIIILLILSSGEMMNVSFEKVFLLQNNLNLRTSEVINTYVYKVGLVDANFSFSAAVGLFNSVVNFTILVVVNRLAKKVTGTSLW